MASVMKDDSCGGTTGTADWPVFPVEYRPSADAAREAIYASHECPSVDLRVGCQICQEKAARALKDLPMLEPTLPVSPVYQAKLDEQKKVEDFKGQVDGGGYKRSMDDPKKLPLSLMDPTFSEGVASVLQYGAKKYAPGNWMRGMSWSSVIDAIRRHITAIEKGEDVDPETGLLHIYHVGCGTMFLARYMSDPKYAAFDDRMFKEPK